MKKNQLQFENLKMLLLITVMLFSVSWVQSQTYITTSTNWSALSPQPTSATQLIVKSGATLTVNVADAVCASIGLGMGNAGGGGAGGGTLAFSANSQLTVSGTVTIGGVQGGTSYTGTVNMANGGKLICNSFALSGTQTKTFTQGTGTVELPATNTLPTSIVTTFNNLIISGGTTTLGTSIAVNGTLTQNGGDIAVGSNTLTVNGTHNAGTNIVTGAGTYTIANTGTLITANLDGITTSGATGTIQTTNRNYNTSNYVFNGGANQVSGNGLPVTLGTVTVQNNSGVFSLTNSNTNINTLNLNPGAKLTVTTGQTVNSTQLNIQSDANGTATILNEGSFNPTQTTAQQYVDTIRNWYMSPVVASATPTGTGTIYRYHEYNKSWETVSSVVADSGHIVIPSAVASTLTFTGTLNDGSRSIKLTNTPGAKAGFNLVGNPYPSYLDVATPVSGNANIDQTIWYRTTYSNNNKLYTFETYGILLDVGTDLTGRGEVTGIVAPMQSFWLKATTTTNLSLSNTNRSHAGVTANPLRVKAKANAISQTLRLEVSNGSNIDQTIIAFNENASDALDIYDSEKWSNNNVAIPEIFTSVTGKELVINGMATSDPVEFVNVGFRTSDPTVRTYTITLSKMNNFTPGTEIILYDGVTANFLTLGDSYSFLSGPVNDPSRFTLIIRAPGAITAINDNNTGDVKIISNEKNQISIFVNTALNSDASVSIYNLTGKLVTNQAITTSRTQIDVQKGMYLVYVTNAGTSTTAKVIIQ